MTHRLTISEIRRQVQDLIVGSQFTLSWSDPEDPATRFNWTCVVQSKPTAVSATYTSADADDPAHHFELPSLTEGVEDEAADDFMDIIYFDMIIAARSAKKSMAGHKKRSVMSSSICAWKRHTWTPALNMTGDAALLGKELVISELRRQLNIPERSQQASFGQTSDHERCALGEAVFGVVALISVLDPSSQGLEEIDQVLNPLLRRLCEHRAGDGKNGKERTESMDRVRKAFSKTDYKNDDITQAIQCRNPRHVKGGAPRQWW